MDDGRNAQFLDLMGKILELDGGEQFANLTGLKRRTIEVNCQTLLEVARIAGHPQTNANSHLPELNMDIYEQLKRIIRRLREGKECPLEIRQRWYIQRNKRQLTVRSRETARKPTNAILFGFHWLLKEYSSHLRQCAKCPRLFVRVKRQLYCSSRCANQARINRYRDRRRQAQRNNT